LQQQLKWCDKASRSSMRMGCCAGRGSDSVSPFFAIRVDEDRILRRTSSPDADHGQRQDEPAGAAGIRRGDEAFGIRCSVPWPTRPSTPVTGRISPARRPLASAGVSNGTAFTSSKASTRRDRWRTTRSSIGLIRMFSGANVTSLKKTHAGRSQGG